MIYASTSVWLLAIVLMAWGVHHIWSTIAKPKLVNAALLPGTLVAQLGHIVGLLITGGTINNTALMRDDEEGEPATDVNPRPKLPVIGPVLVALLPMLALGAMVYLAILQLGRPIVAKIPQDQVLPQLPVTLAAWWEQLRALITLSEATLNAVRSAEGAFWQIGLFAYLMICLTVRMAPLPGNVRGHIGAIVALGIFGALAGTVSTRPLELITEAWPLLSLTVGWLMLLLMISLLIRGAVSAVQMVLRWE